MIKKIILILLVIVLVVIAGVFILSRSSEYGAPLLEPVVDSVAGMATTTLNQDPEYRGQELSYLGKPEILAKYPKAYLAQRQASLQDLIEGIKKNPNQTGRWIDLGLIKKSVDNYVGARDAWEYLALITPTDSLNYYNLANLYGFYLNDLAKAEKNYQKAIQLSPASPDFYIGLANFYRDVNKEKYDLIDNILLDGLKKINKDANLIMNLAYYYKSVGDKSNGIKYFSLLLNSPDISGSQQESFKEEIAALSVAK